MVLGAVGVPHYGSVAIVCHISGTYPNDAIVGLHRADGQVQQDFVASLNPLSAFATSRRSRSTSSRL